MQKGKLTFLLIALFGVGCGKLPSIQTQDVIRRDPTELQISAAKNGSLYCDFKDECEPALALISVATSDGINRCSGFLVSDHEILTNDHCLNSISDQNNACSGLVFAHFTNNVHRNCKNISYRSHQSGVDSKDYAIIELDQPITDRKPLRVSRRGFNNGEVASIIRVQATENTRDHTYNGNQNKLKCHASYQTLMNININSSNESMMSFGDCAIQEGNSGSPIFNESGEVGAIVQAFLSVKDEEFAQQLQSYLLDHTYGQVAVGTQVRCMPELVGLAANNCNSIKPIAALYPKQYLQDYGTFSLKKLPDPVFGLAWREIPVSDSFQKTYFSSPSCISNSDIRNGSFSFTSSAMLYHLGINSMLQAEWRLTYPLGEKQTIFKFQKNGSEVFKNIDFLSSEFGKITIPSCSN